ncbi:DMT family transporter [uncultured Novosphingobium sp.]|uniref:DMT family transporter n=1 Tax=uncultured Novosphingobium sp. TaxID=292277 RepID=UPI00258271E6|nr:DMT family transporter [uncultured Novosphingobium sp.]
MATTVPITHRFAPVLAVSVGIALFSGMDAAIKGGSLAVGVYTALVLRNMMGLGMILPVWLLRARRRPPPEVIRLHIIRSVVSAGMAILFFVAIVRLPIAEGIAITFIAPLIALLLAGVFLKERIHRRAIFASLLGLAGVGVIVGDRLGVTEANPQVVIGVTAAIVSALLYAANLVLQRKLSQQAGAVEVALFQNLVIAVLLGLAAPWLFVPPTLPALGLIAIGAACGTAALSLFAWGYARAEAQVLVPIEYSAFIWAALFGWVFFHEPVGAVTLAGTALIVLGCWIGTRHDPQGPTEQTAV